MLLQKHTQWNIHLIQTINDIRLRSFFRLALFFRRMKRSNPKRTPTQSTTNIRNYDNLPSDYNYALLIFRTSFYLLCSTFSTGKHIILLFLEPEFGSLTRSSFLSLLFRIIIVLTSISVLFLCIVMVFLIANGTIGTVHRFHTLCLHLVMVAIWICQISGIITGFETTRSKIIAISYLLGLIIAFRQILPKTVLAEDNN
jgi:hypothetical protein